MKFLKAIGSFFSRKDKGERNESVSYLGVTGHSGDVKRIGFFRSEVELKSGKEYSIVADYSRQTVRYDEPGRLNLIDGTGSYDVKEIDKKEFEEGALELRLLRFCSRIAEGELRKDDYARIEEYEKVVRGLGRVDLAESLSKAKEAYKIERTERAGKALIKLAKESGSAEELENRIKQYENLDILFTKSGEKQGHNKSDAAKKLYSHFHPSEIRAPQETIFVEVVDGEEGDCEDLRLIREKTYSPRKLSPKELERLNAETQGMIESGKHKLSA